MPLLKFNPPTEAEEQEAFFKRVRLLEGKYPFLKLVFMIPNGARLGATYIRQPDGRNLRYSKEGAALKLQGLRPGVPDIFCAVSTVSNLECEDWHGLFIEMKRINAMPSDTTQEQRDYHALLREQGYQVIVAKGWIAAWNALVSYLGLRGEEVR